MKNKGIPKRELPATLAECHSLLLELFKCIEKLERENRALQERLNTNSSNSSLSPSQDRRKIKPAKRTPSERPSGGQAGHPGHFRKSLDSSAVDKRVHSPLASRCPCGGVMVQSGIVRHQVYELPVTPLEVTEYCLGQGYCSRCQRKQVAALPEGVSWGMTGPRLTSLITHLISKYHFSRRAVQAFLKEQYDFTLSLGTVFNKQRLVNAALEAPVAELRVVMEKSPWLNVDETGHRRDGKPQWLWGAMSSELAYFSVEPTRGKTVLRSFLGCFKQIIISDRYAAYNMFGPDRRQLCWAHLKRDFTRLAEKKERPVARLGKALLLQEAQLFSLWHTFKQGGIDRETLLEQTAWSRALVENFLIRGTYTDPSKSLAFVSMSGKTETRYGRSSLSKG